jgi:hypothetical protein
MGSSPVLALLLPMSVVIGAIVYVTTGNVLFAVLAFALDAVPIAIIYSKTLKARRDVAATAQNRLSRYSSLDSER